MKTYGWDTVSLVEVDKINVALAAHAGDLRMSFDGDLQSDPPVKAKGEYQKWDVVPGGSGRLLYVALTIQSGTLTVGGAPPPLLQRLGITPRALEEKVYDLAGVTAVFAIDLKILRGSTDQSDELTFNVEAVNYAMPPPGEGFVTPVTVIDPDGKLDPTAKSLLGPTLATDLVDHAEAVRFVFASINLIPPNTDSWLAPTASSYAYMDNPQGGKSYLAVLSMTEGRSKEGLPPTVDPAAIAGGNDLSFVISGERVITKMIMPILPQAYSTSGDVFRYENGAVRNNRSFDTFSVKSGAITYHPVIDYLEMRIEASTIRTVIRGRCYMEMGIWMNFDISTRNDSTFDPKTKELRFLPDPNPVSSSNAKIPWYLYFLGPLTILITQLCVSVISGDLAGKINDLLRSALSITQNPPRIVEWQGAAGFNVKQAGLNDSLYLMGELT